MYNKIKLCQKTSLSLKMYQRTMCVKNYSILVKMFIQKISVSLLMYQRIKCVTKYVKKLDVSLKMHHKMKCVKNIMVIRNVS